MYDIAGNIVYIIPPKAIAKMVTAGYSTSNTPDLIYQFWYDSKNRITQKKVPGAKEVYMVYDPLNRVVLTQDGNLHASDKWTYPKYDNANRVVIQGIYDHGSPGTPISQSAMQSYVDGLSSYTSDYYEVRQATSSGYSNQCFPTSGTEERLYNYYDDYDFDYNGSADYSKQDQGLTGEASATSLTYGLATGSKRKILGTSTWLIDIVFYDKYYHTIQVRSNNQIKTGVTDHTTNVVNFQGQAVEAKQVKPVWQVRVLSLERVDWCLPPESGLGPASIRAEAGSGVPVQAPDAADAPPSVDCSAPTERSQTRVMQSPVLSLRQLQNKDRQAWGLVARELPRLGVALERRWAGGGWSLDPAVNSRQRGVAQRLGLMAVKVGALPVMGLSERGRGLHEEALLRLPWAHSADVLDALANVQFAVAALPADRAAPDEHRLHALEQAVQALDSRVHERVHRLKLPLGRGVKSTFSH